MDNILFNKCQSSLEELELHKYPQEVQENFWDFLNNVPFIRWLVSPNRPLISELPRDEFGRAIIDVTKPPILEGSDYFRETALIYQGSEPHQYTHLRPNRNPNSEFGRWIREERRRGWEGYVNPDTGMWVTGDYYWMLNYCPMHLVVKRDDGLEIRTMRHPKFWDGQFLTTHYILQSRLNKHHSAYLASRGKGKTSTGAGMLSKRFIIGEASDNKSEIQCMVTAADKTKLIGTNQILDVFVDDIDFCAKNTQFASHRLKSSKQELYWEMGFKKTGSDVAYGSQNSVSGIISGVNQDKLNGSRGVLYLVEEAGIFKDLRDMYGMIRPSVEQGSSVFGQIIAYGCVCAGTKVIDSSGVLRNIEDIALGDKLLGYNGQGSSVEDITYIQGEAYKECVRITTSKGRVLECSTDHPLLALNKERGKSFTSCSFYRAEELSKGMSLLIPDNIGVFGDVHEKDAFLLGALFGDGNYSNSSCVSLSISTEEEYDYYNNNYDIGISKLSKGSNTFAQIYFRSMHPLLEKYNMDRQSFGNKKLPFNIDYWDKESLCAFLSGYYNADGSIKIMQGKHRAIILSCAYRETLETIQYLLHKIGIIAHIEKTEKPERFLRSSVNSTVYHMGPSVLYSLVIASSHDVITFRNNMHFLIKDKQSRLDSYSCPERPEGRYESLDFVLRENNKGKYFIGKKLGNLRGVTIKKVEYIGKQRIYNLTANTTHTYITNGFISSNTAGNEQSDFTAFAEMFYSPEGFNLQPLENVFDKEGQGRKQCCMFYGAYLNYDDSCMDENGNSNVTKALLKICYDRYKVKYGSSDINTITKRISQYPITPQEAIIRSQGNVFPVTELNERLNQLDNNPSEYDDVYVGELVTASETDSGQYVNNGIKFNPTVDLPIRDFPTSDNKVEGALEIYEMPQRNGNGDISSGRYIVSLDPFDSDNANTMSLGSCLVLDLWTDKIVAEYTGRPSTADELYERVRKICLFYNAMCMYEQNLKGTFSYFSTHNSLHLLADTPTYLRDRQMISEIGYGNRSKGIHATTPIINGAFTMINTWLRKPIVKVVKDADGNDVETTVPNLFNIRNRALIKELIQWNPLGNFDRVMSLVQLILYREEKMILYQGDMRASDAGSSGMENDAYWEKNYRAKDDGRTRDWW